MSKRVLLCLSHAIEEYDQLRLLGGLGYDVASIGGYIDPQHPHVTLRPPVPEAEARLHPEVKEAVDGQETDDNLGNAQARIPEGILEWLGPDGVIVYHHYLERLFGQWDHLREWRAAGGRVIWRTVGQSVEHNERQAQPYRDDGLEIIRYSPRERSIPGYCGEDVMIRFYKDPEEWNGWVGDEKTVINFTQHLRQREPYTNWRFWHETTIGLPAVALGPGSEEIGGMGEMTVAEMQVWLRHARCYLYTGTQPASYTLGLIEALMTGVPVVSIGPNWMRVFPYGPDLFEGHLLTGAYSDIPAGAHNALQRLLADDELAATFSAEQRRRAVAGFGKDGVAAAWREYLGAP